MMSSKEISISERIMVIQEYYRMNLRMAAEKYEQFRNQNGLAQVAHQVKILYSMISYGKLHLVFLTKMYIYIYDYV